MVAMGLAFLLSAFSIDVLVDGGIAPRIFPLGASLLITGLGCLQVMSARPRTTDKTNEVVGAVKQDPSSALPLSGLFVVSIVYALSINYVGYLLATAFIAPIAFYLFGIRSKLGLMLTFFLCPVVFHLIFFFGLGVFPPYGQWFDLLDVIQA